MRSTRERKKRWGQKVRKCENIKEKTRITSPTFLTPELCLAFSLHLSLS